MVKQSKVVFVENEIFLILWTLSLTKIFRKFHFVLQIVIGVHRERINVALLVFFYPSLASKSFYKWLKQTAPFSKYNNKSTENVYCLPRPDSLFTLTSSPAAAQTADCSSLVHDNAPYINYRGFYSSRWQISLRGNRLTINPSFRRHSSPP